MSEKNLPVEPNIDIEELQSVIRDVVIMDDLPDDKKVQINVKFMVVPKSMDITISKK